MVIAVNTRFLLKNKLEGYGYFTREVFRILARSFPEHEFYFLFDRPYDQEFVFSSNVHPLVLSPPARLPIFWKYWYDLKIPPVLKKIRADVFVSPDGFCSLTTSLPQCLVVHDLGFLHRPDAYQRSHARFYKKYTGRFLKKATTIATVSQFSKDDITGHYPVNSQKIRVVYNGIKEVFRPPDRETRERTKEFYTGGSEFFVYVGAIQPRKNLVNLLKAFSIFKKRLQSGMKLVLAGRVAWKNDAFLELLKTYKYREDVLLTGYLEEESLASLLGSAYALVYPSYFEGFGVPVLEAMRAGVPALTSEKSAMQEIAAGAALYFDPDSHADIADKMMLVYKDEQLRGQLVEKGKEVASHYHWERTAALLWESIVEAAGKKMTDDR
jgi:glycosyltransferase involved in cell wall biosynthesis